jgi:hypothetical protein
VPCEHCFIAVEIAGVQDWRWQDRKKSRHHAPPSLGRPGVVKGSSTVYSVTAVWVPCIYCTPCMPLYATAFAA